MSTAGHEAFQLPIVWNISNRIDPLPSLLRFLTIRQSKGKRPRKENRTGDPHREETRDRIRDRSFDERVSLTRVYV